MNHCVLDFEIQIEEDEEYPIPVSKKPCTQNDEIMELLWQNGQVVMHSQNQRPFRKPPPNINGGGDSVITARENRSSEAESYNSQHLFMQEDEMASWLHYPINEDPSPLDHHDFCADILYQPQNASHNHSSAAMQSSACTTDLLHPPPRPPIPPLRRPEQASTRIHNFVHFAKQSNASSSSKAPAAQPTVVDSCDTQVATAEGAETDRSSLMATAGKPVESTGGGETLTCDVTVTSSRSGSSGSSEPVQRELVENRKRKGREPEESFQSEDVDFESREAKKQVRGSTSTKRSRAAEVHNLSERRRRDRINEKMKALQELIPRCNKSDKASMLDEAIEYLKSLQLQVQMMSMGCGMVPIMFPGIQPYMPPIGMGIGMGMGMEMGMGMNRPVMSFPNMLASSTLPAATAAAHMGPRFPMPPFHMPHVPAPDLSRMQAANQSDNNNNMLNSLVTIDPDQSRIPNFTDPYKQYLGLQQAQLQLMQSMNQPNVSKPSTSRGQENLEKHQSDET